MNFHPKLLAMMSEMVYNIECANYTGKIPDDLTVGQLKKILGFLSDRTPVLADGIEELDLHNQESGPPEVYKAQCFMMLETTDDQGNTKYVLALLGRKIKVRN